MPSYEREIDRTAIEPQVTKQTPFVFGIVTPCIAVPQFLTEPMHAELLHDVLAHELGHIQRRDPKMNLLQRIIQILYWINSLVFILTSAMSRAREELCDIYAIQFTSPAK